MNECNRWHFAHVGAPWKYSKLSRQIASKLIRYDLMDSSQMRCKGIVGHDLGIASPNSVWRWICGIRIIQVPVGHSLNVSLMLYRSRWRSLWKCVCIETLMLIGKSSTRRQPCSLMVYKHLMHTREHDNTTSSSLVLVLASPWKMTANLSPCISMRVCKWQLHSSSYVKIP